MHQASGAVATQLAFRLPVYAAPKVLVGATDASSYFNSSGDEAIFRLLDVAAATPL